MKKAIIGGTGVYGVDRKSRTEKVNTKYGEVEVDIVDCAGEEIVFLARHGKEHSVPPHLIEYRANMLALKELGVTHIFATCAVGSCNDNYGPGEVVMISDFIDYTKVRPVTIHDGSNGVKHTDMSDPYCRDLRRRFTERGEQAGIDIKGDAVYACTEGPRFETAAEIRLYKSNGCDVVGMTNVPEVILAKELGMCYAAVGIVTNWCTGMMQEDIMMHEIRSSMAKNKEKITETFIEVLSEDLSQELCSCKVAVMNL